VWDIILFACVLTISYHSYQALSQGGQDLQIQKKMSCLALFPGPTQLIVTCSESPNLSSLSVLRSGDKLGGSANEAMSWSMTF